MTKPETKTKNLPAPPFPNLDVLKILLLPAPPFRSLSEEEQEIMFALYDKNNGNLSALIRDDESTFHGRGQLVYYKKIYDWENRLIQVRTERARRIIENLGNAKFRAIERAMELLETRIVEVPSLMTGQVMKVRKDPMYKEIVAAWEIIKTELGEPTVIAKERVEGQIDHTVREVKVIIVKNETGSIANQSDNGIREELPGQEEGGGERGGHRVKQIILPGPADGDKGPGGDG